MPESRTIENAVQLAADAVAVTRRTSFHDRAEVLQRVAGSLAESADAMAARLAEASGFLTVNDMRLEVQRASEVFRLAAAHALAGSTKALDLDAVERARGSFGLVRREPIGPVVGISAFNGPLLIPAHKLAPAIAAGTFDSPEACAGGRLCIRRPCQAGGRGGLAGRCGRRARRG